MQRITIETGTNYRRTLKDHKPPPTPKFELKVICDANPVFRINPDPDLDVCGTCPKMLCMHYLVGIIHFANYCINRPFIVRTRSSAAAERPRDASWN